MQLKRSPLAPSDQPTLHEIGGVSVASCAAGIKYQGRTDVTLFMLEEASQLAGVYTQSKTRAAPVEWCVEHGATNARAIIINSGNANAFNGTAGMASVKAVAQAIASEIGCTPEQIYTASTGVIGEPLPHDKIVQHSAALCADQSSSTDAWQESAQAIMTTDTFSKVAVREIETSQGIVRLQGIAKGSGMIAPNMATMLGFLFTDARIDYALLQSMLRHATDVSFNAITVDSDTSTSDTVLLAATGASGVTIPDGSDDAQLFYTALESLCIELAQLIVRDGEGASKFITIHVAGAEHHAAAKIIALSVANSPLVKTAIAGEDANWGRIIMALGKTGARVEREDITLAIGDTEIVRHGGPVEGYDETPVVKHMQGQEIDITIGLGIGDGAATVWTCDLTHGYIEINGDYRS